MLVNRPSLAMKSPFLFPLRGATFLLAITSVLITACARTRTKDIRPSIALHYVPEIELVSPPTDFVLIDTGSSGWSADSGTGLIARDANGRETARLKIAPERKSSLVAADIVSGRPNRGDRVYQ